MLRIEMRVCTRCGVEKMLNRDFYKNKNLPGGRFPNCKVCHRDRARLSKERAAQGLCTKCGQPQPSDES